MNGGIKQDFLEDLLYMSCRYAIGRSSISCMRLPGDIAEFLCEHPEIPADQLMNDIRREVDGQIARVYPHTSNKLLDALYKGKDIDKRQKEILINHSHWLDLVNAFQPELSVVLSDDTREDGFYSIDKNGEVNIKTSKYYKEHPHENTSLKKDAIIAILSTPFGSMF